MANSLFKPTFGGLKGNVRTSSIAGGKARGRLPIRNNWILRLIRYEQKPVEVGIFSNTGGHFERKFVTKTRVIAFYVVLKYRQYVISFRHKARVACDWHMHGRTDGQTELRLPRPR